MKSRILLVLGLVLVLAYACKEEDLVQLNPNQVISDNFFQDEAQLTAAVLSPYASLRSNAAVSRWYFFVHDMLGDDHMPTTACFENAALLTRGLANPANGLLGDYWNQMYEIIHRSNTALDGIAANTTVDAAAKTKLEAEARFLRGWAYMELATLYGGAPIYTSRVASPNDSKPRASREEVWNQAEGDLQFAADNLPLEWPANFKGRATKGAALGMLGRTHMQQNDLVAARSSLQALMGLNLYRLNPEFLSSFTEENAFLPENIFEVVFAAVGDFNWDPSGNGTNAKSVRAQEYGPAWRNVVPTTKLANAFESTFNGDALDDPRRYLTVILEGEPFSPANIPLAINYNSEPITFQGNTIFANFYKYGVYYKLDPGGYYTSTTNFVLQRYADVLLLMAEIEAREGNLPAARSLLNEVRLRAGVQPIEASRIPNGNQDEVIDAVQRERFVELASEQVRFRDLQRWRAAGILNPSDELSYFRANKHELLPIPLSEIQLNPNISSADQNPGY